MSCHFGILQILTFSSWYFLKHFLVLFYPLKFGKCSSIVKKVIKVQKIKNLAICYPELAKNSLFSIILSTVMFWFGFVGFIMQGFNLVNVLFWPLTLFWPLFDLFWDQKWPKTRFFTNFGWSANNPRGINQFSTSDPKNCAKCPRIG